LNYYLDKTQLRQKFVIFFYKKSLTGTKTYNIIKLKDTETDQKKRGGMKNEQKIYNEESGSNGKEDGGGLDS